MCLDDRFITCECTRARQGENSWNAGGCCGAAAQQDVDDLGFLRAVVGWVAARADVSSNYAIGMSNGGMMAYRLL